MSIRIRDLWLTLAGWTALDLTKVAYPWGSGRVQDALLLDAGIAVFIVAAWGVALVSSDTTGAARG